MSSSWRKSLKGLGSRGEKRKYSNNEDEEKKKHGEADANGNGHKLDEKRISSSAVVVAALSLKEDRDWSRVISHCSRAIVQIRVLIVRAFEGCPTGSALATGFVVDKRLGLVLTNRHVVTNAPATCEIVFKNDERVVAHQLYVDPVHDFGFLMFNPSDVEFIELEELVLNPDGARPGVDIRVVGSDAGEKMMVLKGTISRVDRNAPDCEFWFT